MTDFEIEVAVERIVPEMCESVGAVLVGQLALCAYLVDGGAVGHDVGAVEFHRRGSLGVSSSRRSKMLPAVQSCSGKISELAQIRRSHPCFPRRR